jgi:DNA-binding transcriptional LysR family regulator
MMQEASALLASIRQVGHAPSGTLRVVLPVGLPPQLLTPILSALRATYPQLHYHVRYSNDPLAEALTDVDIAAHFGQEPPRGNWISYVVLRVREQLLGSKAYLSRRGTPRTIDDLRHHELFAWQAPGEDARLWHTRGGAAFAVDPAMIATDIHFLRSCCISGLGLALVPDALLPDPGALADTLVPVLEDEVGQERPVRISVPSALAEIPRVKMVIDRVRAFLGEM